MTDETPEEVDAQVDAPAAPARRRGLVITCVVLIVALAAAATMAVVFDLRLHHQNTVASAESQALGAARIDAVHMTSYDYRTPDDDFANVKRNATADFQ